MNANTITLALGGDIPFEQFAQTMERFHRLIGLLTEDLGRDAGISWTIDDLAFGSAVVSVRGESKQEEAIERITRAYAVIGESLEHGQPIPYSQQIVEAAKNLTNVLSHHVAAV